MSKSKNIIFKGLHIIAWLIFVGLSIEAGGLLVNFFFSLYKPDFIPNLYQKVDLTEVYSQSQLAFFGMYGFILSIAVLKAYLFYVVVMLQHKLDIEKPFNQYVAKQITKMSYVTLSIGLFSHIAKKVAEVLIIDGFNIDALQGFWVESQAYILMAAVIYVIATLFTRGVEMQTENDLTI
jgi:hypothetical protein